MKNKKRNKGIAIRMIREAMAQDKPLVTEVVLSKTVKEWEKKIMANLIKKGDKSEIINYIEPLDNIALSLAEQEGFSTIEIRYIDGVKIYVIEKNLT